MHELHNPQDPEILSVSKLNEIAKKFVESTIGYIHVEGEVSNLARPSSGHIYLTLKDSQSQIRCAMFKTQAMGLLFDLEDGDHVIVSGKVTIYPTQGTFQIIAQKISELGEGKLRKKFEALKKKLESEGLFDVARKKPIPKIPNGIAIITSQTGAALRDIISTVTRRFISMPIYIYPTPVQGNLAHLEIIKNLHLANENNFTEVIILARGGGSIEDLWCFNEEELARAMCLSKLPIITGVGHETDYTIADFVADYRAPTPTAAAEITTPHTIEIKNLISSMNKAALSNLKEKMIHLKSQLSEREFKLKSVHPLEKLRIYSQIIDYHSEQIHSAIKAKLKNLNTAYALIRPRLKTEMLHRRLQAYLEKTVHFHKTLKNGIHYKVDLNKNTLARLAHVLDTQSPLGILKRGYSITIPQDGSQAIRKSSQVEKGQLIETTLSDGRIISEVKKVLD